MTLAALLPSLAGIAFGGVAGGLVALWSAHRIERKRQAFQREQDARIERAQAMQSARILDSVLIEAEALLKISVVKHNRLWVDILAVPEKTVWLELRGDIAAILEPSGWLAVNLGFQAIDHMRAFESGYRKLGYDDTTDLTPQAQEIFEPVLRDIVAAREALHPVAYPDHIRLPEGHPMLVLQVEQRPERPKPPNSESPSPPASG